MLKDICCVQTFVVSGAVSMPRSFSSWCRIKSACLSLRTEAVAVAISPAVTTIAVLTIILTNRTIKRVSQELYKKKHTKPVKNCFFFTSAPIYRGFFCRPAAEWLEIVRRSLFYAGEPPEASLASPVFHHHFDRLRLRHLIQIYYLRGSHLLIS